MTSKITRRQILTGATLAAAAGAASGVGHSLSALASVTVGPRAHRLSGDALVVLFLRGGADGLNMVVPHGDSHYYRLRPSLALARPNDLTAPKAARSLDLDGFFGLHPALAPLLPLYRAGLVAPIHAVGSGDQTRSHFEAMATMERGLASGTGTASGWLARYLDSTAEPDDSPLRAVALSETMPDSLRGAPSATALTSLTDYRLMTPSALPTGPGQRMFHAGPPTDRSAALADTLGGLYSDSVSTPGAGAVGDPLRAAGRETLAAMEAVKRLDPEHYRPAPGIRYPGGPVAHGLQQAACLIKGDVGLETACLDMNGWDTHVGQGRDAGWQPSRLAELAGSLAAFAADLGPHLSHVTTLVMTEFGRRAYENTGLGTDHGRASCMFLMGGGVNGGKVYANWPGLADEHLDGPGDLRVTTDYRDILAEVITRRLRHSNLAGVFPDYTPTFHHTLKSV